MASSNNTLPRSTQMTGGSAAGGSRCGDGLPPTVERRLFASAHEGRGDMADTTSAAAAEEEEEDEEEEEEEAAAAAAVAKSCGVVEVASLNVKTARSAADIPTQGRLIMMASAATVSQRLEVRFVVRLARCAFVAPLAATHPSARQVSVRGALRSESPLLCMFAVCVSVVSKTTSGRQ